MIVMWLLLPNYVLAQNNSPLAAPEITPDGENPANAVPIELPLSLPNVSPLMAPATITPHPNPSAAKVDLADENVSDPQLTPMNPIEPQELLSEPTHRSFSVTGSQSIRPVANPFVPWSGLALFVLVGMGMFLVLVRRRDW